jgi:hypothetical protein
MGEQTVGPGSLPVALPQREGSNMQLTKVGRSFSAVLASVVLICLLAACGGGDDTTSGSEPSPTATATAGCGDASALEDSLQALKGVDVRKDGVQALTGAAADVANDLDAAVASASSKLQPHVDQVKTAFTALQASLSGLTVDNLRQKAPSIRAAMTQVGAATDALASAVTDSC